MVNSKSDHDKVIALAFANPWPRFFALEATGMSTAPSTLALSLGLPTRAGKMAMP